MTLEATSAGLELVRYLILGTLAAFGVTLLWDFVRGLARG